MKPTTRMKRGRSPRGFTLMELVVVMTLIGLLLTIALPRYMDALDRGKQRVLERNITLMREAIDQHYGDLGRYPEQLQDLVTRRYLRAIPPDPFTETTTWVVIPPQDPTLGGVMDVASTGQDTDGKPRTARGNGKPASDADANAEPPVNR